MAELTFPDPSDRADLGAFVARAVRLDQQAVVRLRAREDEDRVDAWAATPFDVLATRSTRAALDPADVTVGGNDLLAGLSVAREDRVDPGHPRDLEWRSPLPPAKHWQLVDHIPAQTVADLADRGLAVARENVGPQGTPPASLLDQSVLTVEGAGFEVKIPLRCLFALSGMGFLTDPADDRIRLTATDSWLRLDARYGAVVRRRHALLPLLF